MATSESGQSFIGAFLRRFKFWTWRKARRQIDAGNAQFTNSPEGIADAFAIEKDGIVASYQKLRTSVGRIQGIIEGYNNELTTLDQEEQTLLKRKNGALAAAERAKAAGNTAQYDIDSAAFTRFSTRLKVIDARQAELQGLIKSEEAGIKGFMAQLTKLQERVANNPLEAARAAADFVSAQTLIQLHDELNGMQQSVDTGPVSAVREKIGQLKADAKVAQKLAGADVHLQDAQYEEEGAAADASDELSQLLAAREADRAAKTGTAPAVTDKPVTTTGDDRPTI